MLSVVLLSASFCAGGNNGKVFVKMETTLGDMYIELYKEHAPKTVENFLKYADAGFYENTIFHRVIKRFMAQGGGFTEDYNRKDDTYEPIENEATNGIKNEYATIAMARTSNPHSATSQFFINLNDNTFLNHKDTSARSYGYCVFGKVVAGLKTLSKIESADVEFDARADGRYPAKPKEPIKILKVEKISENNEEMLKAMKKESDPMEFVKSLGVDLSKQEEKESGLIYIPVKEGTGKSPKATDTVEVHYTGWLVNGKKFDSSRDRGNTISFPLNRVIPGWTEGVALMKEGGKAILVIPYNIAYGERGNPPVIPPKATLIFEIELFKVK